MKPSFFTLWSNYPRTDQRQALYAALGWSDIAEHPAYKDTCAIRMSVGLAGAGVSLPGASMRVHAGRLKGQKIEPRQHTLSKILEHVWGRPDIYDSETSAREGIGNRSGVVSFFRIAGGTGGHIDLVHPGPYGFAECARSCYFGCLEIWFWPLN